jgi:hypothetical protein
LNVYLAPLADIPCMLWELFEPTSASRHAMCPATVSNSLSLNYLLCFLIIPQWALSPLCDARPPDDFWPAFSHHHRSQANDMPIWMKICRTNAGSENSRLFFLIYMSIVKCMEVWMNGFPHWRNNSLQPSLSILRPQLLWFRNPNFTSSMNISYSLVPLAFSLSEYPLSIS